jgi:S1-C subfamily serine protease
MWIQVATGLERGRAAQLDGDPVTIGSGPGCTLAVSGPHVAPLHATLRRTEDGEVELIAHAEPVLLDGFAVPHRSSVHAGQLLTVGGVEVVLRAQAPSDPEPTLDPALATAIGSDGEHADDDIVTPGRERRRSRRAYALAGSALAVALLLGVLSFAGVFSGEDQPDVAELTREVAPSTLRVLARAQGQEGSGTGWVFDAEEGLVVTNFHVVNGARGLTVAVDGLERDATLVGAAPCDDLAVLRVKDKKGLRTLPLADPASVDQGEGVVAVGYAAGAGEADRLTTTTGVVSVPSQPLLAPGPDTPDFPDMIQTDAAINPGNSGGPLVDEQNRLVGVNTAVLLQRGGVPLQNIGYAIGVGRVREVVDQLRRRRSESFLGTGLEFPPPGELRKERLPAGVIILGAVPGTPADEAGLGRRPLLITSIDGERLDGTMANYCAITEGRRTGQRVTLDVIAGPGGKRSRVPLVLG